MIRDEYINILDIVLCLLLFLHSDITKHLASTNLECLQQQTQQIKDHYFENIVFWYQLPNWCRANASFLSLSWFCWLEAGGC